MKKTFFYSVLAIVGVLLLIQTPSVEARSRHRSTHIQVGIGGGVYNQTDSYVVQRYMSPAPVVMQSVQYYTPVYTGPVYPVYSTPVVAYPAPVYPVYMEQVYVSRPRINTGLSFSWNFFR